MSSLRQRALQAAMGEFKTSTLESKEKWKAIAEKVPGRCAVRVLAINVGKVLIMKLCVCLANV